MKGIILAGGHGTRLKPMTDITNKHLLPIYNKPMIEYPISTLVRSGITDILIVSGREHAGHFMNYLGSGKDRDLKFSYKVQEGAGGIAEALGLAEDFVASEKFAVILGDNIFEDAFIHNFQSFENGTDDCCLFVKDVEDPERFGVLTDNVIIEKPKEFVSKQAVTGLYLYDSQAFGIIRTLKPSHRGELEITDLNNWYLKKGRTVICMISSFWSDAGTPDSMLKASMWAKEKNEG